MAQQCDPQIGGPGCWDFSAPKAVVHDDFYVSAPTALRFAPAENDFFIALCRYPPAMHIAAGQLTTWWRATDLWARPRLYFLNTAALGSAHSHNTYFLHPTPFAAGHKMRLYERVGNIDIRMWERDYAHPAPGTWYHWRLAWYPSFGNLIVEIQYETVGAWWNLCDPFTINDPLYLTADIQRTGLHVYAPGGEIIWYDDTEIHTLE